MTDRGHPTESTGQTPQICVPSSHSAIIAIAINSALPANPGYIAAQKDQTAENQSTQQLDEKERYNGTPPHSHAEPKTVGVHHMCENPF
jgi:hypothetical protein